MRSSPRDRRLEKRGSEGIKEGSGPCSSPSSFPLRAKTIEQESLKMTGDGCGDPGFESPHPKRLKQENPGRARKYLQFLFLLLVYEFWFFFLRGFLVHLGCPSPLQPSLSSPSPLLCSLRPSRKLSLEPSLDVAVRAPELQKPPTPATSSAHSV